MQAAGLCSAALLLLCISSTCRGQTLSYTAFAGSGNSSAASAQSATTKMLSVLFTLAPCSGLQLHVHNGTELIVAIEGNPTVGFINESSIPTQRSLKAPTDLFELPPGLLHWYFNPTCARARLIGTFPYGTNTQFTFAAIQAIPAQTLTTWFIAGGLPPLQGFPFQVDPGCVATCRAAPGGTAMVAGYAAVTDAAPASG